MSNIPILAQTRVLPFARVRRERLLKSRGEVLVAMGARLGALDIVVRAESAGNLRPVPLARYLHVPELALEKYMLKKPGEKVEAREVIASKPEFFGTLQRVYRAPAPAMITALQGSWLAMDLIDQPHELKALYRGTVVNVVPHRGVVIEATGALVQGVWGAGGEGYGVLKQMVESPDGILSGDKIDVVSRGAILLAGAGVTEETIRRAAQERVAGLIVGGLAPQLRALAASLRLPTLVIDGIGECPMSAPIFELLVSHNGDETSINAPAGPRTAAHPEVFIPVMASGGGGAAMPPPTMVAEVGARVRVIGAAGSRSIGAIDGVPKVPRVLESGVSAWGAEVTLTAGDRVFVPWENLELID